MIPHARVRRVTSREGGLGQGGMMAQLGKLPPPHKIRSKPSVHCWRARHAANPEPTLMLTCFERSRGLQPKAKTKHPHVLLNSRHQH